MAVHHASAPVQNVHMMGQSPALTVERIYRKVGWAEIRADPNATSRKNPARPDCAIIARISPVCYRGLSD